MISGCSALISRNCAIIGVTLAAALLHDAVEDQGGARTMKLIRRRFGRDPSREELAVQMDLKIKEGITTEILEEGLKQAKGGRNFVLDKMLEALPEPREELSEFAPRIFTLQIKPEKIGALIGKGGETIQKITAETGTEIDIKDDGTVMIASPNAGSIAAAREDVANFSVLCQHITIIPTLAALLDDRDLQPAENVVPVA